MPKAHWDRARCAESRAGQARSTGESKEGTRGWSREGRWSEVGERARSIQHEYLDNLANGVRVPFVPATAKLIIVFPPEVSEKR